MENSFFIVCEISNAHHLSFDYCSELPSTITLLVADWLLGVQQVLAIEWTLLTFSSRLSFRITRAEMSISPVMVCGSSGIDANRP